MKIQKEKRRRTTLTYTKEEKTLTYSALSHFWSKTAVFIGKGELWMTRRSRASKIDTWAHYSAMETCLLSHFCGNARDPGPWFRSVGSSNLEDLIDISGFG